MSIYHAVMLAFAACEVRWRRAWMRILLVFLAAMELYAAANITTAMRRTVNHPRRVAMPAPPSLPKELAPEFESGVWVMAEEMEKNLTGIFLPLGILIWVGIYPVVLPGFSRRRRVLVLLMPG